MPTPYSAYYTSNASLNLTNNDGDITITVAGSRGGNGGSDAGGPGGGYGNGRTGTFVLNPFRTRTLSFYIGGAGGNGSSVNCGGGSGSAGSGDPAGGRGGRAGCSGWSGSGGGGGGGTRVYDSSYGANVIVAGGGGGGGGGSWNRGAGGGGTAQQFGATTGSVSYSNGGAGGDKGGDGGGGGGGGGGSNGGGGGGSGQDNSYGGGGGGGGGSRYSLSYAQFVAGSQGTTSGTGYVSITWNRYNPQISSFVISSTTGSTNNSVHTTNSNQVSISYSTNDCTSAYLAYSENGSSWTQIASGTGWSGQWNHGQQSVVGTKSPDTVTLGVFATTVGGDVITQYLGLYVYNDTTPSSTGTWTTSFTGNPNTTYSVAMVNGILGIDAPTIVQSSTSGVTFSIDGSTFGNPIYCNAGNTVYIKSSTLAYNTDLTGVASNAVYGKENIKNIAVTVGTYSFTFQMKTAAPRIQEVFDIGNVQDQYPYEDIDLITNTPTQYLTTGQISVNDVDIAVEVKTDNPNTQIRKNGGAWTDMRSI